MITTDQRSTIYVLQASTIRQADDGQTERVHSNWYAGQARTIFKCKREASSTEHNRFRFHRSAVLIGEQRHMSRLSYRTFQSDLGRVCVVVQ